MNVRRIKKKQKRKTILVEDFSPCDDESVESISSRVHRRRDILNELTSIKTKVNQNKKKQKERVPTPFPRVDLGKSQKLVNKKKEEKKPEPVPFSKLDIFKELKAIKNRVSNVLENYEESGPTTIYTNEDMDYVQSLIAKFEENQRKKKAALTTVKNLCRAQLEKFEEFNFEHSLHEIPSELLKDVQHHEFKNAYDAALKSVDKLKSIMSFAAQLSKESEDSLQEKSLSDAIAATEGIRSEGERRASLSLKSDLTNSIIKQRTLEQVNIQQKKDLETINKAYHELLLEKEKSIDAISEVNRLKKELIQRHKEVESLQRSLKTQKQRKFSTVYYDNSCDREALVAQEVKTQDISNNQEKTLPKKKGTLTEAASSSSSHKEEVPTTKQRIFSRMSNVSRSSSPSCSDDLSNLRSNYDVKFDAHMLGTNNAQVIEFECNKSNHEVRKNIPPSDTVSSVNDDNKRNDKAAVSSQQKTKHKLLNAQLRKEKIKNDASSSQAKQRDLDPVKLPEINLRPGNNHSLSKQLSSSAKILIDLHEKKQLTVDKVKGDQRINEPAVRDPSKEEQLDKAAYVMEGYVNMSQLMNKILKEYCEQDSEAYQIGVVLIEEESRNTISKHFSEFIENMISTVDSVDKEMQRDGIFGGEFFIQALKRQWLDSHCFSMQNQQSKDFITMITNVLEMIHYNCKLYLEHKKQSIVEQEKRLSSLQKMNQQVYQKCIKQLNKIFQLPHFIDKSIQKGSQQICKMLEDHIVKVQSAIQTVNYKRELLTMDAKSKIQSCIPEIIKTIDKISSACVEDGRHDALVDGLHTSVRKLNKLCKSTQIVRRYSARQGDAIDKAPLSFLEQSKSAITELQNQVKNFISNNLDIQMPNQFDLEVTLKSAVKHSTAVLPPISSRYIQDLKGQSCNELLQSRRPSVSSQAQRFNESRRISVLDPLMHRSPLETIVDSSNLTNGIQGVTICKQMSDNGSMTALKPKRQNINTGRLPKLHINDHGRRKSHPDSTKMKIAIKNRSIKKHDRSKKPQPLDCLKITSLNYKNSK